jgi:hypothetical protein
VYLCYLAPMLASIFMALMIASQARTGEHVSLLPEDKEISLTGQVRFVHGYGPPGWGEDKKNDSKIVYWVIDLPVAINTPCKPERPEWEAIDCQSTKHLRLLIETNNHLLTEAHAVQGHRAVVKGTLHRQDTAGEITPIYMDVTDIQPAP